MNLSILKFPMGRTRQISIFLSLVIAGLLLNASPGYGIRLIEAQPRAALGHDDRAKDLLH